MTRRLSAKRSRFVEEYLIDFNGAQAAIRAGYAIGSAKVTASRLLTDDNVVAAIAERQKKLADAAEVTAKRVLDELAKLAFANMADFIEVGEDGRTKLKADALTDRRLAAAISQVEVTMNEKGETRTRIKLANKQAALVELAQRLDLSPQSSAGPEISSEDIDPRKLAMAILATLREAQMQAEAAGETLELEYAPEG